MLEDDQSHGTADRLVVSFSFSLLPVALSITSGTAAQRDKEQLLAECGGEKGGRGAEEDCKRRSGSVFFSVSLPLPNALFGSNSTGLWKWSFSFVALLLLCFSSLALLLFFGLGYHLNFTVDHVRLYVQYCNATLRSLGVYYCSRQQKLYSVQ